MIPEGEQLVVLWVLSSLFLNTSSLRRWFGLVWCEGTEYVIVGISANPNKLTTISQPKSSYHHHEKPFKNLPGKRQAEAEVFKRTGGDGGCLLAFAPTTGRWPTQWISYLSFFFSECRLIWYLRETCLMCLSSTYLYRWGADNMIHFCAQNEYHHSLKFKVVMCTHLSFATYVNFQKYTVIKNWRSFHLKLHKR